MYAQRPLTTHGRRESSMRRGSNPPWEKESTQRRREDYAQRLLFPKEERGLCAEAPLPS